MISAITKKLTERRKRRAPIPRLARRAGLELAARRTLDGLYAGMHRTSQLGSSIDFAEHRLYQPGDDLRGIDWRAFARTDRLLLRRWHDERRLPLALLVDGSSSMDYGTPAKIATAQVIAAALGLMAIDQGDEVRVLSGADPSAWVRSLGGPGSAGRLVAAIELEERRVRYDAVATLTAAADHLHRRSLIVVISDLLADPAPLAAAAARAAGRGHEVAVIQVLDASELSLPAEWGRSLLVDPEGDIADVTCDAADAKPGYDAAMAAHLAELHRRLAAARADHLLVKSSDDPAAALARWLLGRRRRR